MSYLVLARRERPQLFGEVVGQHHVVRTLQNAIRSNRVHHAYLFCGTRGVGKTSTARILAKALNCDHGPAAEPCNACSACREITEGNAVDVIEVDAATHRGVEEAQRFLEGVPYRPARLRFKFYIIDEVHMMTKHAFNALLKTFEEPPPHVKFVLATTEAHQVPDTILSRCQRFDFRELGTEEIAGALAKILEREGVAVSPRARSWIVREARGSMRDALSLLDQVLAFAASASVSDEEVREVLGGVEVEIIESAILALAGRDPDRMLEVVAEVVARGHDLKSFLASLLEALRAAMVAKASAGADRERAGADELVRLELFESASLEDVLRWIDQGLRCQIELQRTEEPRLTLETALVRATLLAPVRPLAETIARLEALEGRLGGGGHASLGAPASAPAAPRPPTARAESRLDAPPPAKPSPAPAPAPPERAPQKAAPPPPPAPAPRRAAEAPPATAPRESVGAAENARPPGDPAKELAVLTRQLKDRDPRSARWLDLAQSIAIDGNKLKISLEPGMAFDALKEPETEKRIADTARDVLGRALSLDLSVAAAKPAGPAAAKKSAKAEPAVDPAQLRAIRTKALEDPIVKQALDLFGGEVVDVRPHTASDDKGSKPDKKEKGGRL
ncbi:MAG: DNA polymerase III subunit gamma/tau [bacterium]